MNAEEVPKTVEECHAILNQIGRWTLTIPVGHHVASIPYPMTEENYDLLMATLALWKKALVTPTNQNEN